MTTQAEREALAQEAKRLSTQVANLAGGSPHAFRALTELNAAIDRLAAPPAGQQATDVRDAEAELNCAEEVLDSIAVDLTLEQTAFDCIGDYITAVVTTLRKQAAGEQAQPVARDFRKLDEQISEYVEGYTLEGDDGYYTPTETERMLITDAVMGLIAEPWFEEFFAAPAPAPSAQPLPLLARDIAADLGTTPLQVCIALRELGFGGYSVNMAVTAEMAAKLHARFRPGTPQPEERAHGIGATHA